MSSNGNGNGSKRLIVNADDYGWTQGITDGILKAHHDGIVTSTSMMVNRAASEYALEQMKLAPKLSVGVHLTLCDGSPVLPAEQVPSLVDSDGNFYSHDETVSRLWKKKFSALEIEAEFRAQIRWMKDRGVTPTHADSHHHVHLYPNAIYAFHRAVKKEGILRVRAPRHRYFPKNQLVGQHGGSLFRQMAAASYMFYVQEIVFGDLKSPDTSLVYHPKFRGKLDLIDEGLRDGLEHCGSGTYELNCHPAFSDPGFSEYDMIKDRRKLELEIFSNCDLRDVAVRNGIELISYVEL